MKPKVVILSAFLSPLRSGAEACAEEVALALQDEFDFFIVTTRMRKDLPKRDTLGSTIPIFRVGFGTTFDKWLFPFLAPVAIRTIKPDLIHGILETFAGLALARCKGFKRILTCQTTNRSFMKGYVLKSPDRVTVLSSALKEIVEKLGRDDAVIIPNGIQLSEIIEAREKYAKVPGRVLFVGRLEKMKGVDTLLTAFATTINNSQLTVNNPHLRIVGDGSERNNLEAFAEKLGIADRVTFTGYRVGPDVFKEYAEAEIFCGLSRSEALGNVFLEAQAAGCALIGTKVDGIPDIVLETTGVLILPNDAKKASEALNALHSNEKFRSELTEAAIEHAKQYDWNSIAQKYAAIYKDLLVNQ